MIRFFCNMLRICRPKLFDPHLLSRVVWAQSSASWGSDVLCWHRVLQSWGSDVLCGHRVLLAREVTCCVGTEFCKVGVILVVWAHCSAKLGWYLLCGQIVLESGVWRVVWTQCSEKWRVWFVCVDKVFCKVGFVTCCVGTVFWCVTWCVDTLFCKVGVFRVVWAHYSAKWGCYVLCGHIVLKSGGVASCVGTVFCKVGVLRVEWTQCSLKWGCCLLCGHSNLQSGGFTCYVDTVFCKVGVLPVVWAQYSAKGG
jgi:hypothetical protein